MVCVCASNSCEEATRFKHDGIGLLCSSTTKQSSSGETPRVIADGYELWLLGLLDSLVSVGEECLGHPQRVRWRAGSRKPQIAAIPCCGEYHSSPLIHVTHTTALGTSFKLHITGWVSSASCSATLPTLPTLPTRPANAIDLPTFAWSRGGTIIARRVLIGRRRQRQFPWPRFMIPDGHHHAKESCQKTRWAIHSGCNFGISFLPFSAPSNPSSIHLQCCCRELHIASEE